jgi:Ca2+-binding RTX toxin-like protein
MANIQGTADGEVLTGTDDDDVILGRAGNDALHGLERTDFLYGEQGNDTLYGDGGNDYLYGGSGDDVMVGGAGSDYFEDSDGVDQMAGDVGDDFFIVNSFNGDTIDGGVGTDSIYIILYAYTLNANSLGVTVDLSAMWSGGIGYVGTSQLTSIERMQYTQFGTGGADTFIIGADYLDNVQIYGGNGNDALSGGSGNDSFFGESGNDTVNGELGNDHMDGGAGNDQLSGGNGNDIISTSLGLDIIDAGAGTDSVVAALIGSGSIDGSGGIDTLRFDLTGRTQGLVIDLTGLWSGGTGTIRNVSVTGFELLSNTNYGSQGNDRVTIGADYLLESFFIAGDGDDIVTGGSGIDHLTGGSGDDILRGELSGDYLDGGRGNDRVFGGEGDDKLFGGLDNDTLYGSNGQDILSGFDGSDELFGDDGDDHLFAGKHNDTLSGGAGADVLVGGEGNDTLRGGAGQDRLRGGSEADTFQFRSSDFAGGLADSIDIILDFGQGEGDLIDLSQVDAIRGGADDVFSFIDTGAFSGTAGELRYKVILSPINGHQTIIEGDRNGDGIADMAIRMQGAHVMQDYDFVL